MDTLKLPAAEQVIFFRMMSTIHRYRARNGLRAQYVDAERRLSQIGFSIPPDMIDFQTPIGWPAKAVKVPASRIRPNGYTFRTATTLQDELDDIMNDAAAIAQRRMAVEASLEAGCAFVFALSGDELLGERPVVYSARTAMEATAELDPRTLRVTAALELVGKNGAKLYLPGVTKDLIRSANGWEVKATATAGHDLVPCQPYVWGRSIRRPLGCSRITRPLMRFTDMGTRTLLRQETTAEFFSAPQRALLGADQAHFTDKDGNRISPLEAMVGGIWGLPDTFDEDEGKLVRAELVQLQQATMTPHGEMLKGIGLMVASETSLPIGYLGIVQDNPSSADAIRAAESDMVNRIEHERDLSYKPADEGLARISLAVLHDKYTDSMAKDLRGLTAQYLDAGTPTLAARSDGVVKFRGAFPEAPVEMVAREYGMAEDQIKILADAAKSSKARETFNALLAGSRSAQPNAQQPAALAPAAPAAIEGA